MSGDCPSSARRRAAQGGAGAAPRPSARRRFFLFLAVLAALGAPVGLWLHAHAEAQAETERLEQERARAAYDQRCQEAHRVDGLRREQDRAKEYDEKWRGTPPNARFDARKPDRWRLVGGAWEKQFRVGNEGRWWWVNERGELRPEHDPFASPEVK